MVSTTHFHTNKPAQEFLDELHNVNVPVVFDPHISKEQRQNLLALTKKRLQEWQSRLDLEIKSIKDRYDKKQADEARLLLAPYQLLREVANEQAKEIRNLERAMKAGRVLPEGFYFGSKIFGTLEWGEWYLGEFEDVVRWDELVTIKKRLDTLEEERRPLMREIKLTQARLKELKHDLQRWMREYKRRQGFAFVGLRVFVLLILIVASVAGGWLLYNNTGDAYIQDGADQAVGGALFMFAAAMAVTSIVFVRRHRKRIKELRQDIKQGQARLATLHAEAKKQRLDFYPVNELVQKLSADYKALRHTFA